MINSSLWGQCDSIYTSFVILSLYSAIKNKWLKSFIFLGVAFAFKLQSIFILPLYIILYFKDNKFSLYNFFIIPLVIIILSLPAIIVGYPLLHCISIYFTQATEYKQLTMNMLNFWTLFPNNYTYLSGIGYGFTFLTFGLLLYLLMKNHQKLTTNNIIDLSLLVILISVFFLPSMHERYLYMADVLSIIWYMYRKQKIIIPISINLISFISYMPYLFGKNSYYYSLMSILFGYIIFIMFKITYDEFINKKKFIRSN